MSQYFDLGDETLWNPSNGASRLFRSQVAVFEAELSGGSALLFLLVSAVAAVFVVRRWLADRMPGRTPQDGQWHDGDAVEPCGA